jgi:imidazolonepropionase-like amidohydrolase
MIYDLRFETQTGARSKSAIGLAQSKTLTRLPDAGCIPPGFGVRWPSTALGTLALMVFLLTTAFAETMLLTGATIHTVTGGTITNGDMLIKDGKIVGLLGGSRPGNLMVPTEAKQISLAGLHLYPGMIALNTDLGLVEIGSVRGTTDVKEVGEYTPDVYSWLAVNPDSERLPVARANGISHFEPTPTGAVVAGQSGLMALHGWTTEEMVARRSIGLHVYWPSASLDPTPKDQSRTPARWKSLEAQNQERREKLRELDEFFAEARAYAKAKENSQDFQIVPAWEAMLPVLRSEIPVIIHADDTRQIRAAVSWTSTNGLKMILAEGREAWRVADLLASNNVPVIFNHVFTLPQSETDDYAVHFRAPYLLSQAGVKFSFSGTGGSLVKNLPYVAAQAVAFGLPPDEALKGLTLYPAQIAGVAERLGSIEVGKDATFFVTDGDVLDIRSQVRRMWISGTEVSLENRHTRLYEKYKSRPRNHE